MSERTTHTPAFTWNRCPGRRRYWISRAGLKRSLRTDFNSVLLNYYRDHRDSMGMHSDDEPELGERPILASLSLGEERTFILKHKRDKALKPVRLKLASGSLLLMKGDTQRYWKHGIDKETRPCGPRVNLTFRRILHVKPEKSETLRARE